MPLSDRFWFIKDALFGFMLYYVYSSNNLLKSIYNNQRVIIEHIYHIKQYLLQRHIKSIESAEESSKSAKKSSESAKELKNVIVSKIVSKVTNGNGNGNGDDNDADDLDYIVSDELLNRVLDDILGNINDDDNLIDVPTTDDSNGFSEFFDDNIIFSDKPAKKVRFDI